MLVWAVVASAACGPDADSGPMAKPPTDSDTAMPEPPMPEPPMPEPPMPSPRFDLGNEPPPDEDRGGEVPFPYEGVPAEPGQICAQSFEVVESGRAARVTVTWSDAMVHRGFVDVAAALQSRLVGLPTVEVIDGPPGDRPVAGPVHVEGGRHVFDLTWSQGFYDCYRELSITVRTSFTITCDDRTQLVHSATELYLCSGPDGPTWVSSGDRCTACSVIAEMAPSPIVPEGRGDGLPLSQVLRTRLVELVRVSNAIVLWAEHDGGPGAEYDFHVTTGVLEKLAPDVVLWRLDDLLAPAPLLQVAIRNDHGAAVTSRAFNDGVFA